MRRRGLGRMLSARRPYLMDEWRDAFLTELRLREVPGPQIGEALAEVDAHCTDSGQTPAEAFGDPVSYAATRAADLEKLPPSRRTSLLRAPWLGFATAVGALGLLAGTNAVARGTQGVVRLGDLVVIALGPPLIVAVVALALRPGLTHRNLRLAVAFAVCIAGPFIPLALWRQVVLQLPGPAMLVAGVLLLAIAWWPSVSGRVLADRVVDPRTGREPFRLPAWVEIVVRFGPIVLLAVLLAGLVLLVILVPARP